jgi:hypothetical protein
MDLKEIIIKVSNDRILFNPSLSISINQTNIPKEHLTFRTHDDIFWKVEMLEYAETDKCLKVKVNDYNTKDISKFDDQKSKKEIAQLVFEKVDWTEFEPLLSNYQKGGLQDFSFNIDTNPLSQKSSSSHNYYKSAFNDFLASPPPTYEEPKPVITKLTQEFWITLKEVHFITGAVTFKKKIKRLRKELDFIIKNEHILAEFDNIKYWFARKLKTKRFKVLATITFTNDVMTDSMATSEHFDQINPDLIDSVKYIRTFALTKEPKTSAPDKALFTTEEIFTQMDTENVEGNVFNQSDQDLLNIFILKEGIRNKKQLEYLSDKKQSENYKLRYTLNPNFGFLFLVEGVEKNHFVWELLNSHATYIWSTDKSENDIELQYKRIESSVNAIRTNGREKYKQAYRTTNQDNDLIFKVIKHKDIGSTSVDEFPQWQNKLNEQLV